MTTNSNNFLSQIARQSRNGRNPNQEPEQTGGDFPGQSTIIDSGAFVSASGVLVGWSGWGQLTRQEMTDLLAEADLPADWAPGLRSSRNILGTVMRCARTGFDVKFVGTGKWRKDGGSERARDFHIRWQVVRSKGSTGEIGGASGTNAMFVDLRDNSDELYIKHDGSEGMVALEAQIRREYAEAQANEIFEATHVTAWLKGICFRKMRGARLALGIFIPEVAKEQARRLFNLLAPKWGRQVTRDPLPITTSRELANSIAAGYAEEVQDLVDQVADWREKRGDKGLGEKMASRMLRDLQEISERAVAYRALCGDAALVETRTKMLQLKLELEEVVGATSLRFGLLDLGNAPEAPRETEQDRMSFAQRRADEALAQRQAEIAANPQSRVGTQQVETQVDNTTERGSLLELDLPEEQEIPWYKQENGVPPGVASWMEDLSAQADNN